MFFPAFLMHGDGEAMQRAFCGERNTNKRYGNLCRAACASNRNRYRMRLAWAEAAKPGSAFRGGYAKAMRDRDRMERTVEMKKGKIYEGVVREVKFPNLGVVDTEEGAAVVKNAIPGQKVRFAVTKVRKGKAEGRLLEILERSSLEFSPQEGSEEGVCPHFGSCGGCTYQSLPYETQLEIKEKQIKELLDGVISTPYVFEGIKGSPVPYEYRNKMEFSFGDEVKDGPLALGMHKRGSFHDIVTVDHCRIVDGDFRAILAYTLAYFQEQETPFYKKLTHTGILRHLLIRKAAKTGEIMVDLVTSSQGELPLEMWVEGLKQIPLSGTLTGVLHTTNDSLADAVINERTDLLYGQDYIQEELLGLKFKITPFSFFQTNSLGAEVLYETARAYIGDTNQKEIFDLYSGTGTIAQILAPVAKRVVGVEIVEEAVEAARENAALNGLTNCEFWAGDVLKVIDGLEGKPDLIVLDPPRDGIHPKALDKIIRFQVDRMVYISCKPTSLVRDLQILQERGYRVERACCCDLFCGTPHTECCVKLERSVI